MLYNKFLFVSFICFVSNIYFMIGIENQIFMNNNNNKTFDFEYIPLKIPWPSGIIIEKVNDRLGNSLMIGRLQHNAVQLRPDWYQIKIIENVLNTTDCLDIINRTENYVSKYGWPKGRHIDYNIRPTNDLPMNTIFPNDIELKFILNKIKRKLFQSMSKVFNLPWKKFFISDIFLTQYNASLEGRSYLGPHQDKSQWSFIILLNDDFNGGGTYFFDTEVLLKPPVGSALYFSGLRTHGGSPIQSGVRYILAGFCDYGNYSYESFMELYNHIYDGNAAEAGFRSNDIISALEICTTDSDYYNTTQIDMLDKVSINESSEIITLKHIIEEYNNNNSFSKIEVQSSNNFLIHKHLVIIPNDITDEKWIEYAQSCEKLNPGSDTIMLVKRFLRS